MLQRIITLASLSLTLRENSLTICFTVQRGYKLVNLAIDFFFKGKIKSLFIRLQADRATGKKARKSHFF